MLRLAEGRAAWVAGGGQVGGMGDVVTALGRAVQDEGHDVSVILPKYDVLKYGAISDLTPGREFWFENIQVRAWHGIVQGAPPDHASPPPRAPLRSCAVQRSPRTCAADSTNKDGWSEKQTAPQLPTRNIGDRLLTAAGQQATALHNESMTVNQPWACGSEGKLRIGRATLSPFKCASRHVAPPCAAVLCQLRLRK